LLLKNYCRGELEPSAPFYQGFDLFTLRTIKPIPDIISNDPEQNGRGKKKAVPANVSGGKSRRPSFMKSQVEPQMQQSRSQTRSDFIAQLTEGAGLLIA
jgi:hypothetical protein